MTQMKKAVRKHWQMSKPLVATALAIGGVFNMVGLVLADGTAAGTPITNRATATYDDGTTTFDAISNTVQVTVAEVAGLTVTEAGFIDANTGSINTGDVISFDFLVTNTGNAPTYVHVPGQTALQALVIKNGGVDSGNITSVEIVEVDGATLGTAATVAAGGSSTAGLANLPNGGIIAPNPGSTTTGTFRVRVTMTVTTTTAGHDVGIQFGNTTDNTPASTQNQQNIPDDSDAGANANDLRTINYGDPAVNGGVNVPVNGEREAAASRSEKLFTAPSSSLAQATISKTSVYSDSGTTDNAQDDTIAYTLNFNVLNSPLTSLTAGSLEGTTVNINSTPTADRILVSDVIPPEAVWNGVAPTVPNGDWTVVYSTDDPVATSNNALQANWVTAPPAPNTVKRIGFVYDSAANGPIAPNTAVASFGFTVVTSNLTAIVTNAAISNVSQLFGETAGDSGNNVVFDESGDSRPNNADDGVDPTLTTSFNSTTDLGIGNDADPETTPNGNDGTGPDGESNVVTITTTSTPPTGTGTLNNGPNGAPTAVGPTDNDDDFTNAAVAVTTVGTAGATTGDPNPVTITNEVVNLSTATQLDTVTLLPLAPSVAQSTTGNAVYGADATIPDGTLVTIAFGAQTVVYEYSGGVFDTPGASTVVPNPVVIGTLAQSGNAGAEQDYTVTIDLPAGTPQVSGYGIPIVAFVDNNGNGDFNTATEPVYNITVDRVYPGYVNLRKLIRITRGGVEIQAFTENPTVEVQPGDLIEYRITYQNISEAQPAAPAGGNVVLQAQTLTIVEDGDAAPNNWETTTTHQNGTIATGTVQYLDGTTTVTADPANGATVIQYNNIVGPVLPQASGVFEFKRLVN